MEKRFRGRSPEKYPSSTSFDAKELKTIQVVIKRKVPSNDNQTNELHHSLDRPEEVKIHRSHGEGSHPMFLRDDIVVNKEEPEHRTVSAHSPPRRSPHRQRSSSRYSQRRETFQRISNSENLRDSSRQSRSSPHQSTRNRESSPRDNREFSRRSQERSHQRNDSRRLRSRSRDSSRRSRRSRSRSRSSRRNYDRRRNTRSPNELVLRRRRDYDHLARDRRYERGSPDDRIRSRSSHMASINSAALSAIPLIIPPDINFYGPGDALWFHAPLRPPMMFPRGLMPPRGMYRHPMYDIRPPMPPRSPYIPMNRPPMFRQYRNPTGPPRHLE